MKYADEWPGGGETYRHFITYRAYRNRRGWITKNVWAYAMGLLNEKLKLLFCVK